MLTEPMTLAGNVMDLKNPCEKEALPQEVAS